MNAIAIDVATGAVLDPHGGINDIKRNLLKFVGDPYKRINEDGLRVLRGLRFLITKGLQAEMETGDALMSFDAHKMLMKVSIERVREELEKMFAYDTTVAMELLHGYPNLLPSIFREGLRLMPTLKT